MIQRFVCTGCRGENCPYCGGRGWLTEETVQRERTRSLVEAVAKNMIEQKIAAVGPDEWARSAAAENLTVDQFTEIAVWQATGPISCQMRCLTNEILDALADLAGVEVPPVFIADRPDLHVVG